MIEKLPDEFVVSRQNVYDKLNEVIDAVNRLERRTEYFYRQIRKPKCDHKWYNKNYNNTLWKKVCSICGCDKETR